MIKKIILFTTSIPLILCLLFIWMDWDVKKGKAAFARSHPASITPIRYGDFQLFAEGKDLYKALFSDIQNARKSVYIHFFIIRNDEVGNEFLDLLKKKAKNGVDVKLSTDLIGGHQLLGDKVKDLRNHGVEFTYSRKTNLPYIFYSLHHRNHRRLTIIDGEISYIGGFNMGEEYLGKDKTLGHWRDYQMRITGEGANDAQKQFLQDWEEDTGEKVTLAGHSNHKGTAKYQYIYSSGQGLEKKMVEWIRNAKKSIVIATPYFIPADSLMKALEDAKERGLSIKILVTEKTDAKFLLPPAYLRLEVLRKRGVDIYQYKNGFFHGKVMIIDNVWADVGTINWDKRSLYLNDESDCLIYDKDVVGMLQKKLDEDFKNAERVNASTFRDLPFWMRILKHMPSKIEYYL
jgi:cardiolipin synthase